MKVIEVSYLIYDNGKDIYSFCRQLTQNKDAADDLYQDTFLKAVELSDKIDMKNNPKSYLLSIAVKLWRNRQRKFAWRARIARIEYQKDEVEIDEIIKKWTPVSEQKVTPNKDGRICYSYNATNKVSGEGFVTEDAIFEKG